MAPKCSICQHPERAAIDRALIGGEALSRVAAQYRASEDALARHRLNHLPILLTKARDDADQARAGELMAELTRLASNLNKMLSACDEWLSDPDDPDKYAIGPRAEDVFVVYTEIGPRGRRVRRKERLSVLLARLEEVAGIGVDAVETRYADPRDLLLRTIDRLHQRLELLVRVKEVDEFGRDLAALKAAADRLPERRGVG